MVNHFENILGLKSVRAEFDKWDAFFDGVTEMDSIAVVYNSDIDGLIGALYVSAVLEKKVEKKVIHPYHIGTDEYDFIALKKWFRDNSFSKCVFVDVSIENSPEDLLEIQESISGLVFVYDHHIARAAAINSPFIAISNPTPKKLERGETPVPTFLFAQYLAIKNDIIFPDWLLLLAIFAEGVDSFFPQQIEKLFYSVFERQAKGKNQRKSFKNTRLSKASSLIRAAFSGRDDGDIIFDIFSLQNISVGYNEIIEKLSARYASLSKIISDEITNTVDHQIELIKNNHADDRVIVVPISSYPSVVGPVASILRQYFPDKVFLSYLCNSNSVMFEIRVDNHSPINIVTALNALAGKVTFYNYGGHPMAAGGLLKTEDLQKFMDLFVSEILNTY